MANLAMCLASRFVQSPGGTVAALIIPCLQHQPLLHHLEGTEEPHVPELLMISPIKSPRFCNSLSSFWSEIRGGRYRQTSYGIPVAQVNGLRTLFARVQSVVAHRVQEVGRYELLRSLAKTSLSGRRDAVGRDILAPTSTDLCMYVASAGIHAHRCLWPPPQFRFCKLSASNLPMAPSSTSQRLGKAVVSIDRRL
jgi:hypothetical protein